jgi:hypothetical protein
MMTTPCWTGLSGSLRYLADCNTPRSFLCYSDSNKNYSSRFFLLAFRGDTSKIRHGRLPAEQRSPVPTFLGNFLFICLLGSNGTSNCPSLGDMNNRSCAKSRRRTLPAQVPRQHQQGPAQSRPRATGSEIR